MLDPGRLSISMALSLAFCVAVALALIANLFAEQSISIYKTIHSPPPATTVAPVALMAATAPAPQSTEIVISSDALSAAFNRVERAMAVRIEANNNQAEQQLTAAGKELSARAADFNAQSKRLLGHPVPKLSESLARYVSDGQKLIELADSRQSTLNAYWTHFEALNTRVKALVDGAWKIFGRVIARQSLIRLSTDLDDIRRQATILNNRASGDVATITSLVTSEEQFLAALEQHAKSMGNSGARWLPEMRADYSRMVEQQQALLKLDAERDVQEKLYAQARGALVDSIPSQLIARQVTTQQISPQQGNPQAKAQPAAITDIPATSLSVSAGNEAVAPSNTDDTTTIIKAGDSHVVLAWLSGAVLILLVAMLALIARSIVYPVRKLLKATEQMSRGQLPMVLPGGGIKELNALAGAFNQMAEQLAVAQANNARYQQSLELKVEQRTRELQRLAEHDPLTQLPNRRQLFTHLDAAIKKADQCGGRIAVFFVDVDNFKYINDSLGHAFGDRVLLAISQRLEQAAQQFGFAARLGGDEFTLICEEATNGTDIERASELLAGAFHQPLSVDEHDLSISVSIGMVTYPDCHGDAEALLRAADAALFRAKALGRSQINVFTADLLKVAEDKFTIEQGLRRAIERSEFELVFQPELCAENLEVKLVEALIRWRLPDGRLVPPGEFLAVAEESGLIMDISDWVMRSAIEAAAHWYHGEWPGVRIAINVSPRQLMGVRFVENLQLLLQQFKLPPECIEIELTETVLQTGAATIATLRRIKKCGIAIALDDFGTGYSSLASLEQLPLSRIKLDRSLIESIDSNPQSAAITRAIISLSHGLGLEITAEGLERPEQFAMLLGYTPIYLQGYLLSRPVSQQELVATLPRVSERAQELLLNAPPLSTMTNVIALNPTVRRPHSASGSRAP